MKRRDLLKSAASIAAMPLVSMRFTDTELFSDIENQDESERATTFRFNDERDWFFESKFGMFVHWGIYAIPAWHEQHQQRANVPRNEYVKYASQFNPTNFDPEVWLDLMQEAGMKYLTITTKHHDGFCMWNTKQTGFNIMNTPYGKDIIAMLTDACHKRNIPICFYYSVVDWNHPNYPNQGRHHELPAPLPGDHPDWEKYMEFLKAQVRELCTNYGEIHGFWWDQNVPEYVDPSVNKLIRELQPKAVINNRGFDEGDFGTPERDYDKQAIKAPGFGRPTEACQSVGVESWGYKEDEDYFTTQYLERSIDQFLCRGANYLLNVGPTSTGEIPDIAVSMLKRIGLWYKQVEESFKDVKPATHLTSNSDVMLTMRGKVVYIHLNQEPQSNRIKLKPFNKMPLKAVLLNNGVEVECAVNRCPKDQKPYLRLRNLPQNLLQESVLVIRLEFDSDVMGLV